MKLFLTNKLTCALVLALGLSVAQAQVSYVNLNATGNNDGTSWADAYTDLSVALEQTSSGEIWVASGTYHPGSGSPDSLSTFLVRMGVDLYGGFAGTEGSLSERDISSNPTILSGDILNDDVEDDFSVNKGDNVFHVIVVDSTLNETAIIDGFTIVGGNTSASFAGPEFHWRGGGIYAFTAVQVRNCTISGNFAGSGAGLYLSPAIPDACFGSVIEDCTFSHNASNNQSAGIYLEAQQDIVIRRSSFLDNLTTRGALYTNDCLGILVDSCIFTGNTSVSPTGFGGAYWNWQSIDVAIRNSEFSNNFGGNGGVMYLDGRETTPDTSNFIIENCAFTDNAAGDWGGGCLYVWRHSYTLANCTFNTSSAPNTGGMIYNGGDDKSVAIRGCSFRNGSAGWGGAIANYGNNSDFLLTGNAFTVNQANTSGGAVTNGFLANVTLDSNLFENNTAEFGGALFSQNDSTTVTLLNSTFNTNSSSSIGGAISISGDTYLQIDGCDFVSNFSENGGAISISGAKVIPDHRVLLANNTYFFNSASGQGGALEINDVSADVLSSVFSLNSTTGDGYGGALINNVTDSTSTEVRVVNCTFVENSSVNGPCLAQWTGLEEIESKLVVQNNIFLDGAGPEYVIEDGTPELESNGGNWSDDSSIQDHASSPLDEIYLDDPKFLDPNNFDFHLTEMSPFVNAGVDEGAPEFDIEGKPREGQVDVGAYEFQTTISTQEVLPNNGVFRAAPNPVTVSTELTLENSWQGPILGTISSMDGKTVKVFRMEKSSDFHREVISLQGMPAGMYHVAVTNGTHILVCPIQKL